MVFTLLEYTFEMITELAALLATLIRASELRQ